MKKEQIAIIGGGPGGLTLARLLQQAGMKVTVYERDENKQVRQQGATLDLHDESGLKALAVAGLMDKFREHYRPGAERMRITDQNAEICYDDHAEPKEEQFGNAHFRPEIDRGPLRDLLIESLEEGTIRWNAQFSSMQPSGKGWELYFKNGQTGYADLVIAADGANSRVRPYLSAVKPVYSGITIVEGNIYNAAKNAPRLNSLAKGGKVFALGEGKTIILSAKGEGSLSFYTGTREQEDWQSTCAIDFTSREQVLHWFKERFTGWSPVWKELFDSNESYFVPRPMYHYPADQSWKTLPNLTMIGDAAHRMPPYAGEGVNMAMLDALELYEALTDQNFRGLPAAMSRYETKMLQRAAEVTQLTLEQTEALHAENSLGYMLEFFKEQE